MPNEKIGRFEIISFIGRGGMAAVYQAFDPEQDRPVAIKVLGQEYQNDLGFRARFEREAETIARLDHPAIVPLYEFGQHEGKLYIVMEFMPDGSLADRIAQSPLSMIESARILERVGAALDYAHSQGIVHRDLKPSNILFDQDGSAFLADFGIALQSSIFTQDKIVLSGTPAYMSPEQARKEKEIDGRSDLYSLGITVYESLTGVLPFDSDTPMNTLIKRLQELPPSPREINPDLPLTLEPVFEKILAADPVQRYQSGAEFSQAFCRACDLDHALEERPDTGAAPIIDRIGPVENLSAGSLPGGTLQTSSLMPAAAEVESERGTGQTGEWREVLKGIRQRLGNEPVVLLVLVSLLGILSAAIVVGLIRAPMLRASLRSESITETVPASGIQPGEVARLNPKAAAATGSQEPNTMLVYTDAAVTLINISTNPLSLDSLLFKRVTAENNQDSAQSTRLWEETAETSGFTLPVGACYQLLAHANGPSDPPPEPLMLPNCDSLQGWSIANEEEWLFWMPDEADEEFQVLQGDLVIQTCSFEDGLCKFHLPQP